MTLNKILTGFATHLFQPILCHPSLSIPAENITKPKKFTDFHSEGIESDQ